MKRFLHTILCAGLLSTVGLSANETWIGSFGSDLTLNTNWSGAMTPSSTELAIFDASMTANPFPVLLDSTGMSNTFNVAGIQFSGTPGTFFFTIDGQNTGASVIIGNSIPSVGVDNSQLGASAPFQFFTILNNASLSFGPNSSADVNSTGKVSYQLFAGTTGASILFNNASAGGATINSSGNGDPSQTNIIFQNQSNAQTALINSQGGGTLQFIDSSAGSCQAIISSGGILTFSGTATPDNASFTANNAIITTSAPVTSSTAKFFLQNLSTMNVMNTFAVGEINTSANSPITLNSGPLIIGNNSVLEGNVTGSGELVIDTVDPEASVRLASTSNTYTGGTSILSGILDVTLDNLPANQKINVLDGTLTFSPGNNTTFSGQILDGNGKLFIQGPGVFTITGDNSAFRGSTETSGITVTLLNTLGGDFVCGGILRGTGTILGNLTINESGTVQPGTSIGTLHVGGNYLQEIASVYEAEIDGDGNSDLIDIDGTATLSGFLSVVSIDGVLDKTKTYLILHADQGVQGTFIGVFSNEPTIVPRVTYTQTDVLLTLEHLFTAMSDTHNQRAVARQLESISNPTPEEQAILAELTTLGSSPATVNAARHALSQMSGEQYTTTLLTTELANRQFLRRLYDPLRNLLAPQMVCQDPCCCCWGGTSYTYPGNVSQINTNPSLYWYQLGGSRTFLRHDSNASGFKARSIEFSLGIQTEVKQDTTVGFAAGYQHDDIRFNVGGNGKNNTGLLGAYALYRPDGYYFLADALFSFSLNRMNRTIQVGDLSYKAHGNPTSYQCTFYGEGGADFSCGWLQVQPFAGLEIDCYMRQQFKEHGASPLNLDLKFNGKVQAYSRLGVHLASFDVCRYLTFNLDLAWQYRLSQAANHVRERFTDFGGSFTAYGVSLPRNSIEGALYAAVKLGSRCSLFLDLSGQRWERLSSYNLTAGLLVTW